MIIFDLLKSTETKLDKFKNLISIVLQLLILSGLLYLIFL